METNEEGMLMFLLHGCGVTLICSKGNSMIEWIGYIIERGGVPTVTKLQEVK